MPYQLMKHADDDRLIYVRSLAARIARVSEDFIILCEHEGLVTSKVMTGGGTGYSVQAIRQLTIIHRLYHDLDLDLGTIELVLHMRKQILDLQAKLVKEERRARLREKRLLEELRELRELLEKNL